MLITVDIYYDDLTEEKQKEICQKFNTTPEEENWDVFPLAETYREIED